MRLVMVIKINFELGYVRTFNNIPAILSAKFTERV